MAKQESVVEQVKALQEQIESLRAGAIAELLAKREDIDKQLQELGHSDSPAAKVKAAKGLRKSKPLAERYCEYCKIKGHDARAHRTLAPGKKFSESQLNDLRAAGKIA